MSFPELLDAARALPRDEQLQLAHALLDQTQDRTGTNADEVLLATMFPPGMPPMEIWSAYDAHEAAIALQRLLDEAAGK